MTEIFNKRDYTQKHFDLGDGIFKLESHAGHIHYFDKLDSGIFREIDWKLQFDDIKRGWFFNYHSFRPFLPEYSDEWVEFRDLFDGKDQTIRYKAQCEHVKGELVDSIKGLTDTNAVIYPDAFGKGYDYILYFTRSALKKVVRIREEFKKVDSDLTFNFELELPKDEIAKELDVYRADKKEDIAILAATAYKLDLTKDKIFDTAKQLLVGNDKADGKEWFTYMRTFSAWDSEGLKEKIDVKYYNDGGRRYLQKIVSLDFLNRSAGDVFTDTTTSYYAGAGDGSIENTNANWNTCITASSGGTPDYSSATCAIQTNSSYAARRLWFAFDTSGIPDTDTISAANFIYTVQSTSGTYKPTGAHVSASQASTSTLDAGDFDQVGSTALASAILWDTTGVKTAALNENGIANISKTGYTKMAIKEKLDFDVSTAPTQTKYGFVYMSEQTGTSSDPYLEVTYSAGASTFVPQIIII